MSWNPPADEVITVNPAFLDGLARLETAGGKKSIKGPNGQDSFNLYNIKDNSGRGFRAVDKAEGSNDAYRTYASHDESKADVVSLLARRYPGAVEAQTPEQFARALKSGGYATDPNYEKKLVGVIKNVKNTNNWAPPDDEIITPEASSWTPPEGDVVVTAESEKPQDPRIQPQASYDASPRETGLLDKFASGGKLASAMLGATQGMTLGFGDEIGAGVQSLVSGTKYKDELAKRRAQIEENKGANPGTYRAAEFAGAAPAFLAGGAGPSIGRAALGTAAVGGASGLGNAEGSAEEQARQAALGAIVGGAAGGAGRALTSGGQSVINKFGGGAERAAKALIDRLGLTQGQVSNVAGNIAGNASGASRALPAVGSAGASDATKRLGAGAASATGTLALGGSARDAALAGIGGAIAGPSIMGKVVQKGAQRIGSAAVNAATNRGTVNVTTQALLEMSRPQAKKAVAAGNAQIEEAVANGQPAYAAKFTALQNPTYRQGTVVEAEDEDEDDEDED